MLSLRSNNYYSTNSESEIAEVDVNLVKGHPENHTTKFYKSLSLMVNPSCRVSINGQEIFVHKALGLNLTADKNDLIYDFRILDPNVNIYYIGSW